MPIGWIPFGSGTRSVTTTRPSNRLFGSAAGMFWNYLADSRWNWLITE